MAVTRRTLAFLHQLRVEVGRAADDAVHGIVEAWATAWDTLAPSWQAAVAALVEAADRRGRWPSAWQIARVREVSAALQATTQQAQAAAAASTGVAVTAAGVAVAAAVAAEPWIIASQLPASLADAAAATYGRKILPTALDVITRRAGQQITALSKPLSGEATAAVKRALVAGVRDGTNPTVVGRNMLRSVEGAFNGGATRAATIARTEILDAYRGASEYAHQANDDVLAGWTWIADLGPRCCPACWAMHGTHWPLSTPGPEDHQQGRCARIPRLKPWADLGIPVTEPGHAIPDAQAKFAALSRSDQLRIMGPARLEMLDTGDITWADLALKRTTKGWRNSYAPRPVSDLERIAGRRRKGAA